MIGSTIDTYRVLSTLGQGGMGTVYLAEHVLLGRRVALKVLLPRYSRDQDIVRRFFNEARAAASISDPGIVQIFDFGFHTDGSAYIVMELLEGEPLDARLRRQGRLLPLDAARLVRQCAGTLAAVHAGGIVHRDIKPENLYAVGDPAVTGGERIKVLDFGIAKLVGGDASTSRTRTGVVIGTPIYMSPEQCRGMGEVGFRSDVYSLGCVLFALLAGCPPFLHESSGELIVAHLTQRPPSLADLVRGIPRPLDDIVQRCLAKGPGDRFVSMQSLAHSLDVVIATALSSPAPSSSQSRPMWLGPTAITTLRTASGAVAVSLPAHPPVHRRGRLIAVTAAVAIALGFGAVALHGRDGRGQAAALSVMPEAQPAPIAPAAPPVPPQALPPPPSAFRPEPAVALSVPNTTIWLGSPGSFGAHGSSGSAKPHQTGDAATGAAIEVQPAAAIEAQPAAATNTGSSAGKHPAPHGELPWK